MARAALCLALESSCDETAAAVVGADRQILSNVIFDQTGLHARYGGVVPEIAARAHAERLDLTVRAALEDAGIWFGDLELLAVTAGPGLIGGVLSGVMCAKGLAAATGLPLAGVNHLAGHALTPRLTDNLTFPYLTLLVSGGHCQFLAVAGPDSFHRLGGTIDDAPGEAFDKTARLLGLGYPGGPEVERCATAGDPTRFAFPRPLLDRPGCDLSFSGLKTALRRARDLLIADQGGLTRADQADLCASFQRAVAEVLAEKTRRAIAAFADHFGLPPSALTVAGGVAANTEIRSALKQAADDIPFAAPPLKLCTDNAAMIAWAALEQRTGNPGPVIARPRWPLDSAAAPLLGGGKKGAKA